MSFHIIIPARLESSRLPNKVLLDIAGKPMLQWVYEQAVKSAPLSITIATDNEKIAKVAKGFDAKVCMTGAHHTNGTSRITEAAELLALSPEDIIVNVQADEPLLAPESILQVAHSLQRNSQANLATLCEPIDDEHSYQDANVVKVVKDAEGYALYFSRASIPWFRDYLQKGQTIPADDLAQQVFRHIGIYAYRVGDLKQLINLPEVPLERIEALEQLRALYYGFKIAVQTAIKPSVKGVDTAEDLERVRAEISSRKPMLL